MTYDEVLKSARGNMGPYCKVCPVVSYRITCNNGNQRTLINP